MTQLRNLYNQPRLEFKASQSGVFLVSNCQINDILRNNRRECSVYIVPNRREYGMMKNGTRISNRVSLIPKSAIHEMTRLSKEVDDVAFLSWAKPTAGAPNHIREGAIAAIRNGHVDGYSENAGLVSL